MPHVWQLVDATVLSTTKICFPCFRCPKYISWCQGTWWASMTCFLFYFLIIFHFSWYATERPLAACKIFVGGRGEKRNNEAEKTNSPWMDWKKQSWKWTTSLDHLMFHLWFWHSHLFFFSKAVGLCDVVFVSWCFSDVIFLLVCTDHLRFCSHLLFPKFLLHIGVSLLGRCGHRYQSLASRGKSYLQVMKTSWPFDPQVTFSPSQKGHKELTSVVLMVLVFFFFFREGRIKETRFCNWQNRCPTFFGLSRMWDIYGNLTFPTFQCVSDGSNPLLLPKSPPENIKHGSNGRKPSNIPGCLRSEQNPWSIIFQDWGWFAQSITYLFQNDETYSLWN